MTSSGSNGLATIILKLVKSDLNVLALTTADQSLIVQAGSGLFYSDLYLFCWQTYYKLISGKILSNFDLKNFLLQYWLNMTEIYISNFDGLFGLKYDSWTILLYILGCFLSISDVHL